MWRLTFDDQGTYTDDLTMGEVVGVEAKVGESWVFANPIRSAKWAVELSVAVLVKRGATEDEARERVLALTTSQMLNCIESVADRDDRPDEFRDGMPIVDPKAEEVATATT
jgi:hypothetical protein